MDGSLVSAEVPSPAKHFLAVGESSVNSLMSDTEFDIPVALLTAQPLERPLNLFFWLSIAANLVLFCTKAD